MELYWYITHEEYEAFAPHGNTPEDPYWSDSDSGRRRVPVEIALPLAREWVRRYGARRSRMGYYDNAPINEQLRRRELGTSRVSICYDDYREAMATVGRSVPEQEEWWLRGRVVAWPRRRTTCPAPPSGIWVTGWTDLIPGNSTMTTSTSSTLGQIGKVENVSGRKRTAGEVADHKISTS